MRRNHVFQNYDFMCLVVVRRHWMQWKQKRFLGQRRKWPLELTEGKKACVIILG